MFFSKMNKSKINFSIALYHNNCDGIFSLERTGTNEHFSISDSNAHLKKIDTFFTASWHFTFLNILYINNDCSR